MQITILSVEDTWRGSHYFDKGFAGGLQCMKHTVSVRTMASYVDERPSLIIARPNGHVPETVQFLRTVKKPGRKIGVWVTGDTTVSEIKALAPVVDFGLTAWRLKAVKPLMKFPILEVPPASDIPRFRMLRKPEQWDVGFIGCRTPDKARLREWVEPVLRGHSHRVVGHGWFEDGFRISEGSALDLALRSRVCLNIHDSVSPGSPPNQRLFQLVAWGRIQVVDEHPRLKEFFSEDEIPAVSTPSEYAQAVKYALSEDGREDLAARAKNARKRAKAEHSFSSRARRFLEWLETL